MKNNLVALAVILSSLLIITLSAAAYARLHKNSSVSGLKVSASFYPLAEFAKQVGGDKVNVINITPAGTEPHDFEPTAQDIAQVEASQVVIVNGNGVDAWADRLLPQLDKTHTTLRMSDALTSLPASETPGQTDPHYWLDPHLAVQEVQLIEQALSHADPTNATYYQANAAQYIKQLNQLDQQYQNGLSNCDQRDIVTAHAAFGYLAKRYNLTMIAVSGLSPDSEPSAQKIAQIAGLVHQKNIRYIFFESLTSPKLANTLATEAGVQTLPFNPLEGLTATELTNGKNYISVMQNNLKSLQIALGCQ